MSSSTAYQQLLDTIAREAPRCENTPEAAVASLREKAGHARSHDVAGIERSSLLFACSSLMINCGSYLRDPEVLEEGRLLAEEALGDVDTAEPLYEQLRYNIANAVATTCDLGHPDPDSSDWEQQYLDCRLQQRDDLRFARRLFFEVGSNPEADPHTRSAALCNLANSLDHSGRWAEAYDFYLRALEVDPSNGNAAGNLAQLLQHRIAIGIGQTGHIAAVYDKYVRLAQTLRDGTVRFAGSDTANKWDSLELTNSSGHLAHGLENQDEYREWVAVHRLALSPAVEGLGSEELRWDSAVIERLHGSLKDVAAPPILAEFNTLKSDFLVSRRLAFEGIVGAARGPGLEEEDSGYYVETLDYSLYGVKYSKMTLAQRSSLDVLDKTAVITNEYFGVGDNPGKVTFRKFWSNQSGSLRPELKLAAGRNRPLLAMAELAYDMQKEGMYAESQALRNAGTHRIVHAALLDETGATPDSRSRVGLLDLIDSTVLALQLTRSAFLYLIDLVAMKNHPDDHSGHYVELPTYEYLAAPEDPSEGGSVTD